MRESIHEYHDRIEDRIRGLGLEVERGQMFKGVSDSEPGEPCWTVWNPEHPDLAAQQAVGFEDLVSIYIGARLALGRKT